MENEIVAWLLRNPVALIFVIIALSVLMALLIVAFFQGRAITLGPMMIGPKPEKSNKKGQVSLTSSHKEIYKNSDDPTFADEFISNFRKARRVVLIGTGFYVLRKDEIRTELNPFLWTDHEVEIYAANPFSPNVETRLIEEETGNPDPNIGKSGLVEWLRTLLKNKTLHASARLSLKLFPFYPTYALFIFDDRDYYFYPYGYARLGTMSPVFHYWKGNPDHDAVIKFLDEQYKLVKERSVDAESVFHFHPFDKTKVNKNELTAFAVYLIPPAGSRLYEFGSKIIGYDVRAGQFQPAAMFPNAVGAAGDYGLHVTLADALYCATKSDIDLICKEVEFLANDFRPFLMKLSLEKDFPNERGIALVCQDRTGSLEALHHEMVSRVYRKAAASNYNFDPSLADRDRDEERAKLMIKYYHAPYILQRFKPHFSLLSNVPPEQKEQIYAQVRREYEEIVRNSSIEISQIAVMHRPDPSRSWKILQEYPLGGAS